MTEIKKRLASLYSQKAKIEQEIQELESKLNQPTSFSKQDKIELFRNLFVCREDIYAKKWVSQDGKKEGFYPVTTTFKGEDYQPLTNEVIEQHLRGNLHIASYLISAQQRCKYVVLEISSKQKEKLFAVLSQLNITGYLEVNSKTDLLVWIFFEQPLSAKESKAFVQYLLQYGNFSAKIYPNQEFSNRGNLGSAVELPLHLHERNQNRTVFIDFKTNEVIKDQWLYLSQVKKVAKKQIQKLLEKDDVEQFNETILETIVFPKEQLKLFIYDFLYIPVEKLSASLINHLKALACFDNPQVKTLLALRKPLYNIPRVIKNYEEDETYLKLPRGLIYDVIELFESNSVKYEIIDKKFFKQEQFAKVIYTLRDEQSDAIEAITKQDFSICVAPPGFGKTLIGAKMVEIYSCSTLVVVNKNMLLDQWRERFVNYFEMDKKEIGFLGKGKNKLNGKLDVATMQSLKNSPDIIKDYAFVIVDECHHIPAVTFEQIIKEFHGRYILGLSATPNRKDGFEPILFQQLGKIAYEYKKKRTITHELKLIRTNFMSESDVYAQLINELCEDEERNRLILDQIRANCNRKILILTDRIEHIKLLEALLIQNSIEYVAVHGSLSKKEQNENMQKVEGANLILATTSFFGEGIDFPHLNTIIFATPISYYGRLVQYLGRIGRDGQACLAIDLLDSRHAMLNSAYKKRAPGYKQMHYQITI